MARNANISFLLIIRVVNIYIGMYSYLSYTY